MSTVRPRLLIAASETSLDAARLNALTSHFDVIVVDDPARVARRGIDFILGRSGLTAPSRTGTVVDCLGDGAGEISAKGEAIWMNPRLADMPHEVRRRFIDGCVAALEQYNNAAPSPADAENGTPPRPTTYTFTANGRAYELLVSPASGSSTPVHIESAVGVLWDVTAGAQVEEKIQALDAAGAELLRFDPDAISTMNVGDRLRLLEKKIIAAVHEILEIQHFEVRLLDRKTNRLELVISSGIPPLAIGEFLHALPEGNGICGIVATTGQSMICPDVKAAAQYREGLPGARSSLTTPLVLHDRVVGVFNAESTEPNAFDEDDLRYAELFGRYIAMAMNILDLLVVERYTTNQRLSDNVIGELRQPIEAITLQAESLRQRYVGDSEMRQSIDRILTSITDIRARVLACTSGPRTILGAEQALGDTSTDPMLVGKKVLVADDEPQIRQTIMAVLAQKGALVTPCADGKAAIEALEAAAASRTLFDLIISDVRMPDRNGYEVFRAAKALNPDVPVILMTGFGYDPNHSIVRATQEGLHCFLFKPFQVTRMMEEIAKALNPRSVSAPG